MIIRLYGNKQEIVFKKDKDYAACDLQNMSKNQLIIPVKYQLTFVL